jgi:DNA primase catalytic core
MRRIPEEEIERLKRAVALADLCAKYGIELKPRGRDLFGSCPFHEDREPSFSVTPEKNLWNCLAGCGGGSNFDLVMRREKVSFTRAYEILKAMAGEAPEAAIITPRNGTRAHPILIDPAQEHSDAALLETVTAFYHQTFLNHPQAMTYLQQRGCFHPEAVTKFRLGYANRTLGYRLPGTIASGKTLKARLQKIGILRETGHEHLCGCVVVPVWNERHEIAELYGRRITKPIREANDHLYLPGPHGGVWNADEIRASRQWLLCESAIDALSLWCHGFHAVTWSYGVNGFSPDHWALLRAVRPERVIVCYDNDEAGNKGANELAQQLEAEGVEAWIELPAGCDVNDVVKRSKHPKAELASLLAAASRMLPAPGSRVVPMVWDHDLDMPLPIVNAESFEGIGWVDAKDADQLFAMHQQPPPEPHETKAPEPSGPVFTVNNDTAELTIGERRWRVRGLESNTAFDHLKVNVRVEYRGRFHIDVIDFFAHKARQSFLAAASEITGAEKAVLEPDLLTLLNHLEKHQESRVLDAMRPAVTAGPDMAPEDEMKALALLNEPRLLDLVLADLHRCGLVGEDTNLIVAWLVSLSRKLEKPLGVCVMSRSAAGKSSLLEAVAQFVPDEDRHQYTALTPQALFHMPENELRHKALFVAEDVGAEGAAYSLKTIQSDGQLVMACTMKDENTGHMMTKTKIVKGPLALFLTSTSRSIDDELLNRLLVLTIDEGPEQTRRIHEAQRHAQMLEGIMERRARPRIVRTHQNVQRLIRPLVVRNPYAKDLSFGSTRLRSRRDHQKYLDLINVMALVHQYQRPIQSAQDIDGQPFQYIEVTRDDIARVDAIMREVLEQSTDDLWPASRRMLAMLEAWARELPFAGGIGGKARHWTRREIREKTAWSDTQVRMVLGQLVEFEYLFQHGGGQGRIAFYQLAEAPGTMPKPPTSQNLAVTSQSPKCEVASRVCSSLLAANKAAAATSQTLAGVQA